MFKTKNSENMLALFKGQSFSAVSFLDDTFQDGNRKYTILAIQNQESKVTGNCFRN
jgi:hypothetical protein